MGWEGAESFHSSHSWGLWMLLTLVLCGLYIFIRGLYDGLRK